MKEETVMKGMKRTEKSKDMTMGSPMAAILRFSIPLIIGTMFQQGYNIVVNIHRSVDDLTASFIHP